VEKILESFFHKAAKQTFGDSSKEEEKVKSKRIIGANYLSQFHSDPLSTLMNGRIKEMLRIIPHNVVWGGQSQLVFNALEEDFMKPVIQVVENLLNNTPVEVNVYSGQLDMIVDTSKRDDFMFLKLNFDYFSSGDPKMGGRNELARN
jgi:hypothetical protein